MKHFFTALILGISSYLPLNAQLPVHLFVKTDILNPISVQCEVNAFGIISGMYGYLTNPPAIGFGGSFTNPVEKTWEIRIYPEGKGPKGFYIGPYWVSAHGLAYTSGSDYNSSATFDLNWGGMGVEIGYQAIIAKCFSIDFYFGLADYAATNSNLTIVDYEYMAPAQGYTGFPYSGIVPRLGLSFGIGF